MIAQIPNASFETWTAGTPNGWSVTSSVAGTVTQVSPGHAGSSSVSLNSVSLGGNYYGGAIKTGGSSGFFSNTGNFSNVSGWYKLNVSGGDELYITASRKCAPNTGNGGGAFSSSTNTNVFTQFTATMADYGSCTSDSAEISITLTNLGTGHTSAGSYAIVDDLALGAPAGINEISNDVTLEKAYPNPANDICNIIYSIPSDATVNVSLYDISGRMVQNLLDDTKQARGRYKIPVDVSGLASGIYVYRIMVDGQTYSQKLTVSKN